MDIFSACKDISSGWSMAPVLRLCLLARNMEDIIAWRIAAFREKIIMQSPGIIFAHLLVHKKYGDINRFLFSELHLPMHTTINCNYQISLISYGYGPLTSITRRKWELLLPLPGDNENIQKWI